VSVARLRAAALGAVLASIAIVAINACATTSWDGRVDTWGTMHAVMHDGDTGGKVRVSDAISDPHAFGIGALSGLTGEIAILDGVAWTSRVDDAGRVDTAPSARADDQAALLAVAHVEQWNRQPIERDVALGDLGEYVRARASDVGLEHASTIPFIVSGELDELDAHVLNGRCPYAGPGSSGTEPVKGGRSRAHGTLVGFYTAGEPGRLTHQGQNTHVHVVLAGPSPFVGHVDGVRILSGASLSVPAR
jgi:hypothetical protein